MMNLLEIDWPVFRLSNRVPLTVDGVTFYLKEYINKERDVRKTVLIIDDKNIKRDTLGARRLLIEKDLAPIKKAIYFLGDLIKAARHDLWFIDNKGKLFKYKKGLSAQLKCFKITKVIPGKGVGVIVTVGGIPQRFKLMYHPPPGYTYIGLLRYNKQYIVYGVFNEEFKTTRRVI